MTISLPRVLFAVVLIVLTTVALTSGVYVYRDTHRTAPETAFPWPATRPATYSRSDFVPQSTVADVIGFLPEGREAFARGYFAAINAYDAGNIECAAPWYYSSGGRQEVEDYLQRMSAAKPVGNGARLQFYMRQPMAEVISQMAYDFCATHPPPGIRDVQPATHHCDNGANRIMPVADCPVEKLSP